MSLTLVSTTAATEEDTVYLLTCTSVVASFCAYVALHSKAIFALSSLLEVTIAV